MVKIDDFNNYDTIEMTHKERMIYNYNKRVEFYKRMMVRTETETTLKITSKRIQEKLNYYQEKFKKGLLNSEKAIFKMDDTLRIASIILMDDRTEEDRNYRNGNFKPIRKPVLEQLSLFS